METSTELKQTPLREKHIALGAKMVPFAGYEMPVQYTGVTDEHHSVRSAVGVFDVSHMGEFRVQGPQALELLQWVTSNDVSKLTDGKVQYSCLPNEQGGIVDDLLVYRIAENDYLLVVNASNMDKDWNWIQSQNRFDVTLRNDSDNYALLAVQGPKAIEALQSLTKADLSAISYYTFVIDTFAGVENVIISATGYTGAGGFELYVPTDKAEMVWDAVFKAGEAAGIKPAGLAARDTLRLEMGFCLYGNDINDTTSPIEAGLGWITKFSKEFVNSVNLKAQKENGVSRKLVGFELVDRGIPRHDYPIVDPQGNEIGIVTSGTMSPSTGKAIGMGYVNTAYSAEGADIAISIRSKAIAAKVVKLPFYKA
ncbi:MAG: glycine cleavage system aminomethyltransferase GcvT [Cryomorphaceae bacterium]|nr:glycine cleavage system aminomethyltransferase GcvT [Cryomorphaceae bacterium]